MWHPRTLLRSLGGPDVISTPAFLITWVLAIFGHFATGTINTGLLGILGIVSVAHCLAFVPLVLLRLTLLSSYTNARPLLGLGGILLAGVLRGFTISTLIVVTDLGNKPLWGYRIIAALASFSVVLIVCAMCIHGYRQRVRDLEYLTQLNLDLAATTARAREEVTSRNEDLVEEIRGVLNQEFSRLSISSDEEFLMSVQHLAADVVRPLSHDLERSLPAWKPERNPGSIRVSWRQVAQGLFAEHPIHPQMATLFVSLLLLILGARAFPSQLLLIMLVFIPVFWSLLAAINVFLTRLTSAQQLTRSVVLMIFATGVASFTSLWAATLPLGNTVERSRVFLFGSVVATIDVLLVSFWFALRNEQERLSAHLDASALSLRRELARIHQTDRLHTKALARALHGPIQMTATASALKLDVAKSSGLTNESLRGDIERSLREALDLVDIEGGFTLSLPEAFDRITSLWEGVCTVQINVSQDAELALGEDVAARAALIEIITDAVSNSVRHGKARNVICDLSCEHDLILTVTDDGDGTSGNVVAGVGTKVLDECCVEWQRESLDTGQRLKALIPIALPE